MGASSVNLLHIFGPPFLKNTFTQEHLCVAVSEQYEPSKWKSIFDTNHYVIRKDHKVFANLYTDIVLFFAKSSLP